VIAASANSDLRVVSTEWEFSAHRAKPSNTGKTRSQFRWQVGVAVEPGRVDSPPTRQQISPLAPFPNACSIRTPRIKKNFPPSGKTIRRDVEQHPQRCAVT